MFLGHNKGVYEDVNVVFSAHYKKAFDGLNGVFFGHYKGVPYDVKLGVFRTL